VSVAPAIRPLTLDDIPAVLDIWAAQRARAHGLDVGWERQLAERRAYLETGLRATLAHESGGVRALVAPAGERLAAYLIAHEVRLPPDSGYRAYAPDHFLSIGSDDWGLADPRDGDALATLYAAIAEWGLQRGADAQMLAIQRGNDSAELWRDLGFSRQDEYAFLPLALARPAVPGVTVREATAADLDTATRLTLAEAHHHHRAPIFAFAPPGLDAARRRDMANNLDNPVAIVLLAEIAGVAIGSLIAHPLDQLGRWMPSVTPTPCLFIESAFVEPTARGQGVLRALVARLAALAGQRALMGLFVTYLPANRGAARAWRGLGFTPLLGVHQRRIDPRAANQHRAEGA
jgi:GNAT superfamily N-acetyltransferase